MELIYTERTERFEIGKKYRNPSYFSEPERGVARVIIEGSYPNIETAYRLIGVDVEVCGVDNPPLKPPAVENAEKAAQAQAEKKRKAAEMKAAKAKAAEEKKAAKAPAAKNKPPAVDPPDPDDPPGDGDSTSNSGTSE